MTRALRPTGRAVESFGSYVVFEQLGMGGMATVHHAERVVGGVRKRVALKRLLPHAALDPDLVASFLREASLVKSLHHRNIAEMYEVDRVGNTYFLAMELVAGPTLKSLIRRCIDTVGLMPYPIVVKLLAQVCDALAYAHDVTDLRGRKLGIVHRDVSPSNIVISANGVAKLIDFGVAKTMGSHTQTGIIKGKLGYIAPEYIDGNIDHRADLWAVGVVAWEMLTNKRLFSGDDDLSTLHAVMQQPIDPPSMHNPDVPPELDAIVMKALHRDPDQRWQNAGAISVALNNLPNVSSNAELVEWVDWVFALAEKQLRPARGSRPLKPMNAQKLVIGQLGVPPTPPTRIMPRASTPMSRPSLTQVMRTDRKHRALLFALLSFAAAVAVVLGSVVY